MAKRNHNGELVYSTDQGSICPQCNEPEFGCRCTGSTLSLTSADGIIRVSRQSKGRKGKGVTLISGLPLDKAALKKLATEFKNKCGCGGAVKDGIIEIQGEQRDKIVVMLKEKGYPVKRAGG